MIKAIETDFDGHLFRSRLEASWAVFFNHLKIKYEYEKEGFHLDGKMYLPDFWLPEQEIWIEIKGQEPTERERDLAMSLAAMTKHHVLVFWGPIPWPHAGADGCSDLDSAYIFFGSESSDSGYYWSECRSCHSFDVTYNGREENLDCKEIRYPDLKENLDGSKKCPSTERYNYDSPALLAAYDSASKARF